MDFTPLPAAAARLSPPRARRGRQPDLRPIPLNDSEDENFGYQAVETRTTNGGIGSGDDPIMVGSDDDDAMDGRAAQPAPEQRRRQRDGNDQNHDDDDDDVDYDDDDDDDDDFQDAMDYYEGDDDGLAVDMHMVAQPAAKGSMISADCCSGPEGALAFTTEFSNRYGPGHPDFYIGSLHEAIQTAFTGDVMQRKLLAVYIHHDASITTNVFCSQVLCSMPFVTLLSASCVVWGWDITLSSQRANLLTEVSRSLGDEAASALRISDHDNFPTTVLISQSSLAVSSLEVAAVIPGPTPLDQAVAILMSASDEFKMVKERLRSEQTELETRRAIIKEQEVAFQASLEADRAKAQHKADKLAEARRAEEARVTEEREMQLAAENEERARQAIEDSLPEEPGEGASGVYTMCFRLPDGNKATRRFLPNDTVELLLRFVASRGYAENEHEICTTYPRKDLTQLKDRTATLASVGLKAREMLIVSEKYEDGSDEEAGRL